LIEQPEIHLNPHQQLELPNLFVEIIKTTAKQFIIETHSEYFLKRLGTLIAQQTLSPDDVIVYYCHTDEEGSHMQPIEFDDLGVASWWPEQFLSEGFEGAAEHLEAIELRQEAA
jgi:predicted ATPase